MNLTTGRLYRSNEGLSEFWVLYIYIYFFFRAFRASCAFGVFQVFRVFHGFDGFLVLDGLDGCRWLGCFRWLGVRVGGGDEESGVQGLLQVFRIGLSHNEGA